MQSFQKPAPAGNDAEHLSPREAQVLDLFDSADLTIVRGGDRDYHARIEDPRIDRVRFLRPQEIPTYVEQGIFDLGISGRDWVTETGADVVRLPVTSYVSEPRLAIRVLTKVICGYLSISRKFDDRRSLSRCSL